MPSLDCVEKASRGGGDKDEHDGDLLLASSFSDLELGGKKEEGERENSSYYHGWVVCKREKKRMAGGFNFYKGGEVGSTA